MNTAKTLQLLDANNNNISPAVCVESLYFEKQNSGTTYRMSLKNRMLVAGDTITTGLHMTGAHLNEICIPAYNIQKAAGTSNDVSVYQLNCSTYNIGAYLNEAINASLSATYYSKTQSEDIFVKVDGTNCIKDEIYVGSGSTIKKDDHRLNALHLTSKDTNKSGIAWNANDKDYVFTNTNSDTSIRATHSLTEYSPTILLETESTSMKMFKNSDNGGEMKMDVSFLNISANSSVYIGTAKCDINATNAVNINTNNGDININSESGNIHINPKNEDGLIYLFDRTLSHPEKDIEHETNIAFLTTSKTNTKYFWRSIPLLEITSTKTEADGKHIVYMSKDESANDTSLIFKDLVFNGDDSDDHRKTLISYDKNFEENIGFKSVQSGDYVTSLNSNDAAGNNIIQIATINNQPLIQASNSATTFNYNVVVSNDISTYSTLQVVNARSLSGSFRVWGATGTENGRLNDKQHNCSIGSIETVYFKNTGAMYAQSFYASSDERLKTEINEIDFVDDVPEIKQFVWKDSSLMTYGFIAQELEAAGYGNLISEDDNGYKKVDYNAALSLKVASLQKENKELKTRLNILEEIVNKLISK